MLYNFGIQSDLQLRIRHLFSNMPSRARIHLCQLHVCTSTSSEEDLGPSFFQLLVSGLIIMDSTIEACSIEVDMSVAKVKHFYNPVSAIGVDHSSFGKELASFS